MKKLIIVMFLWPTFVFGEIRPFVAGDVGVYGGNSELKSFITGGVGLGVDWDYFSASFGGLLYKKGNRVQTLSSGSFDMYPLMLNAFIRIPVNQSAAIRLGGGGSYIIVDHDIDSIVQNSFKASGLQVKEDIDSGLGCQVDVGLDINLTKNIALGEDIAYLFFKPDATASISRISNNQTLAKNTSEIDLSSVLASIVLKYRF